MTTPLIDVLYEYAMEADEPGALGRFIEHYPEHVDELLIFAFDLVIDRLLYGDDEG